MDEKKVRDAIEAIKSNYPTSGYYMLCEALDAAIEALEKQLPKKPITKTEKEVPRTHNLGRLLRFHCPSCGRFIVGMYETDVERGGGISNRLKGCSACLQAIDFSEYYTRECVDGDKLNENIEWND